MSKTEKLEHSHSPEAIERRVNGRDKHSYLKDFVYGAIDGVVTTFAVVSGVAGAGLQSEIIVVLGLANLLGDGFSMAASNFLGTRTEDQQRQRAREMERRHIQHVPEGEREEVRQIYAAKGFSGDDLERAVTIITSDEERWIDTMLVDELGVGLQGPSALKAAVTTFISFFIVGLLPLIVFLFGFVYPMDNNTMYVLSTLITGLAFFLVGAAKSWFVDQVWYRSGLETLLVGGIAAGLAYLVGVMLQGVAG